MARAADKLSIEERIERITDIFSTFRNPDKETVLTPWRVVNMHLGDCLGGYNFYDTEYQNVISEPRFIDKGEVTAEVFSPESRILEINSKSGLYPLYMAYGIYRARANASLFAVETVEEQQAVWDKVIAENIFVICKTPMAKSITKRTLAGFRKAKVNTRCFEDLINQIKSKPENFIAKVAKGRSYWKAIDNDNMKFNAIVGNPPYQIMDGGAGVSAKPVYNLFVEIAKLINPTYISMIMPSRWFAGGKGLDSFRANMLSDKRIRYIFDYINAKDCFPTSSIGGGVNYILWDANYHGDCSITTVQGLLRDTVSRPLDQFAVFIRYNPAIQFRIVSRTEIIGPNDVCTDSYLIIGASEDKSIVENEYKYIQTRFARFLLMLAVSSINLSPDKFQFIPLQNFTERSDINWNNNISDIDKQLYIKYDLSREEIAFIEKMIKTMQ